MEDVIGGAFHDLFNEVTDEVEAHPSRYQARGPATPKSLAKAKAKKVKLIQDGMLRKIRAIIDAQQGEGTF